MQDFILPYCQNEEGNKVLEIGVGGGRVACEVAKLLKQGESLTLLDISSEMLKVAQQTLDKQKETITCSLNFVHNNASPDFPQPIKDQCANSTLFTFIYSFDVFVHVDMHTFY